MSYLKKLSLAALAAMAVMAFIGASTASATTLEIGGVAQTNSVTLESSLTSGTSAILKDKNGTTNDTCTGSTVKGSTESTETTKFTGAHVGGTITSLTFTGCSHTTHVLNAGSLSVTWSSGTNGTVSSSGAEVTVRSTVFGASATCKTGSGTVIGTLTGATTKGNPSAHALMDISATTLDCGILGTSSWTGSYTVTSPTDLGVIS